MRNDMGFDASKSHRRMPPMSSPSRARERYLMAIAKRQRQSGQAAVGMGELAEALAVTPGTATTMVRRLAEQGLVAYTPYSGVALTPAGRRQALTLVRRHRLLECFLVEVLGYDWSDVHDEAERLEHGVSDSLLTRIDATRPPTRTAIPSPPPPANWPATMRSAWPPARPVPRSASCASATSHRASWPCSPSTAGNPGSKAR
jgi:Mn-dependent DtxR family transcriptional regulator